MEKENIKPESGVGKRKVEPVVLSMNKRRSSDQRGPLCEFGSFPQQEAIALEDKISAKIVMDQPGLSNVLYAQYCEPAPPANQCDESDNSKFLIDGILCEHSQDAANKGELSGFSENSLSSAPSRRGPCSDFSASYSMVPVDEISNIENEEVSPQVEQNPVMNESAPDSDLSEPLEPPPLDMDDPDDGQDVINETSIDTGLETIPEDDDARLRLDVHSTPLGLPNIGNSCFLNAILRALFCMDGFVRQIRKQHSSSVVSKWIVRHLDQQPSTKGDTAPLCSRQGLLLRHLNSLMDYVEHSTTTRDVARTQLKAIWDLTPLEEFKQHDAHEVMLSILSLLPKGNRLFSFRVRNTLQCIHCDERKESVDDSLNLQLATVIDTEEGFFGDAFSDLQRSWDRCCEMEACLRMAFDDEVIDDFKCGKCNQLGVVLSRKIASPPSVLAICLMRFGIKSSDDGFYGTEVTTGKVSTSVTIPERIDLSDFCLESSGSVGYSLQALISHEGHCLKYGHYICDARLRVPSAQAPHAREPNEDPGFQWYTFNDSFVMTRNDIETMLKDRQQTAYILFYNRDD